MTQDEALKLALEALINAIAVRNGEGGTKLVSPLEENAITAIKEALAQDELCSSQEPVAADLEVRRPNGPWQRYNLYSSVAVAEDAMRRIKGAPIEVRVLPLYTTPPKRPWVGLTDEEYDEIWRMDLNNKDIMDKTIAKLKEKNT